MLDTVLDKGTEKGRGLALPQEEQNVENHPSHRCPEGRGTWEVEMLPGPVNVWVSLVLVYLHPQLN